jgi:hypothetical protein
MPSAFLSKSRSFESILSDNVNNYDALADGCLRHEKLKGGRKTTSFELSSQNLRQDDFTLCVNNGIKPHKKNTMGLHYVNNRPSFELIAKKNKPSKCEEEIDKYINDNGIITSIVRQTIFHKDMSSSFNQNIKTKSYKFNTSSAAIIQHHNGYLMNIRIVNYFLNGIGKSTYQKGDTTITYNKIVFLDNQMNITNSKNMITKITNNPYLGIEDIRLFFFRNDIYYIGSSFNPFTEKIQIVSSILDFTKDAFDINYITPSFKTSNKWEKNWVFFNNGGELNIIYQWFPVYICKIDYKTKQLHLLNKKSNVPSFFGKLRGSTNGVEYDNKIWFITHFQHLQNPMKKTRATKPQYLHCFVVFDKNMDVVGYSAPFNFENYLVEYCIGMTVNSDNNDFIISYSTLDCTTKVIKFSSEYVNGLIIPYCHCPPVSVSVSVPAPLPL